MKYWSLFTIALLTVGCSSQPIEPTYYLLRPTVELHSRTLQPSSEFALGDVTVASYVDQQGLLLETSTGEIRPARHHLWAEPMYESVRTFLDMEISRATGADIFGAAFSEDAIVVDIRIDRLHGTYDGRALLVAYWWLRRDKKIMSSYQYAERMPLSQDGYAALADAEKALLSDLAQRIAATLVKPGG